MSDRASVGELEKFELLSAYLDDEVTVAERNQVNQWLQEDPAFKAMYQRLRGTQQSLAHLPLGDVPMAIEPFAEAVFAQVERRQQRRWWKLGGGVAAAALVALGGAVASGWEGFTSPAPQWAKLSIPSSVPGALEVVPNPASLMVALNKSIVEIAPSKTAIVADESDDLDLIDEDL